VYRSDSAAAAESGRGRLELGDDTGVSPVSGTGRGSAGRRRLGPEGQLGRVRRWAVARVEAIGRAGEHGYWAGWLLRAAAERGLLGWRGCTGWAAAA
jgi:hypothetical protein